MKKLDCGAASALKNLSKKYTYKISC